MFVARHNFKHRLQLDVDSTAWGAVELGLKWPFFIATVFDESEDFYRDFMIFDEDLLLKFAEEPINGQLTAVHVLLPPAWSQTSRWAAMPVTKVQRPVEAEGRLLRHAYLTTEDDTIYGGMPMEPVDARTLALATCWIRQPD